MGSPSFPSASRPVFSFTEYCGLSHAEQVVEVTVPSELPVLFTLRSEDGRLFFGQRSRLNSERAFLKLGVRPFEKLVLRASPEPVSPDGQGVSFQSVAGGRGILSNGFFSLEVPVGAGAAQKSGFATPGPVCRLKIGDGPWRGGAFFDTRQLVRVATGSILEEGPLRLVYRYRVEWEAEGFYEATITVDAGQPFAVVEEVFEGGGSGSQVVWDFSGEDLPEEFYVLNSSAAFRTSPLSYHHDLRLARLAAWTQQSQHLDFADGFAFRFGLGEEVAGLIALEGGKWRGARSNHVEAWVRRWLPGDPSSRRDVPASSKADSYPGPERVPSRGGVLCEEHFNAEAWIGHGRRKFALVLTRREAILPPNAFAGDEPELGPFEDRCDRDRCRRQQSLLRRIQIQHGVMPLQEMIGLDFSWPEEPLRAGGGFEYPNAVLDLHFQHLPEPRQEPKAAARTMFEYLSARVYGFWEGSGLAYTNPVSSRRIAPELFRYEWLVREGALSQEERNLARALFAFLIHLFSSENCYTGDATMLPAESPDSTEPTLAGMANQNFYTDVINLVGAGGQVFSAHPQASAWRTRFIEQWHRQLAFHLYPESGVWEESHTYYQHVLLTVLPTLLRRRADGEDDESANPAFQKMVEAALKQLVPRDTCFGNRRYMLAFGDHDPVPLPERFHVLAEAFAQENPRLARQLAWAAREMGWQGDAATGEERPEWRSEQVQGLGVFFREVDETGCESLLALRSGLAWGHHHNDDGSIQFFAKGRSLVVDSAFSMPGGLKVDAAGHSRWSLRDLQPVNYFWRFNRGWITGCDLEARFPWASSFSPVYTVRGGSVPFELLANPALHWRSVARLDATTYLVVDASRCGRPQVVRFHLAGQVVRNEEDRAIFDFPGGRLSVIPLLAPAKLRLGSNHPGGRETPGEYSTTSACYDVGEGVFSAFLLRAGEAGETVDVVSQAARCTVRAGGLDVDIQRLPSDQIRITDRRTGQFSILDLHTHVTH